MAPITELVNKSGPAYDAWLAGYEHLTTVERARQAQRADT